MPITRRASPSRDTTTMRGRSGSVTNSRIGDTEPTSDGVTRMMSHKHAIAHVTTSAALRTQRSRRWCCSVLAASSAEFTLLDARSRTRLR
jgi:hypothetical protein